MVDMHRTAQVIAEQVVRYCEQGHNLQWVLARMAETFPPPTPPRDPPLWRQVFTPAEQETMATMMIEEMSDRSAIKDQALETLDGYEEADLTELIMYIDPDSDVTCECLKALQEGHASMDDYLSNEHPEHYVAAQLMQRFEFVKDDKLTDIGRKYLEEYG